MNRRNFLQQLASKLLGHPVIPADVWEQKISGNFRLGEVLANILGEPSESLLREVAKDPKAILIEILLNKLGPSNHPLIPSTPYTPEFLVSNLLQVTVEPVGQLQIVEGLPDVRRRTKLLSHTDYRLWDFEAKPLLTQRSKDYEALKELLYRVVSNYVSKHPNAKYDDIAGYLWAEYQQEISDYARSFTSMNRKYFMQFIIREGLFDTLCAMALLFVEEAGSKGCRYSDIISKLSQFPEYGVLLHIWPPYKNEAGTFRSALKECLEGAKFTKIGATSNLLWKASTVSPRTDKCDHLDSCNICKIRLRCRICSNSSPNSSGNTCMRCTSSEGKNSLLEKQTEIISLSDPSSPELVEDKMDVSEDDMHLMFAEAVKEEQAKIPMTAQDKEFWISTWGEIVAVMDVCPYPTTEELCDYPSIERTQYRDFSEFLVDNVVTETVELPKNIEYKNPYFLREADREWYRYIKEYYINHKLVITQQILDNIASRFGVTSAYICNTLKSVLKIALLDCAEKPTVEQTKYKLAICASSSGDAWIDDWYYDTFNVKVITDNSIAQLGVFKPDAALIWVASTTKDDVAVFKKTCESLGIPYFFRLKSKSDAVESARDAGINWFIDAATSRKGAQRYNPLKRNPDERISVHLDGSYWIYTQKNKIILRLLALPISSAAGTAAFKEFIALNCGFLVPELIPHQEHSLFIFKDLGSKTFVVCKYAVTDIQMVEHLLLRLRQDTGYTKPVYSVVQNIPSITVNNDNPFTTFIGRQTVKFVNLSEYLQMGILQQEESTKIITALPTFDQQTSPTGYLLVTHGHAARFDFEIQLSANKKVANQQWRDIWDAINDSAYLRRVLVPGPNSAQAIMLGETRILRLYCVVSITAAYQIYFMKNILKSISQCPVKIAHKALKEQSLTVRKKVAKSRTLLREKLRKLIQKRKRKKPKD